MNPHSDCTPTKKQTKALHQAQRRADPVMRRLEQSSNNVRRCSARTNQAVQEHESEQQAAAREVPGVREQEQSANTVRRAIARDPRARVIRPLFLPRGAQIKIEYNPRRPSIQTIVRQVEALGYRATVEPFRGQREIINCGFTSQRVGAHLLLIYPPPLDPQWNEEEIAKE